MTLFPYTTLFRSRCVGVLGGGGGGLERWRCLEDGSGSAEEEEDDGIDPKLSGLIPPSRRTRTTRRRRWRAQLAPGKLLSTAMRRRLQLGHGHGAARVRVSCSGGKERGRESRAASGASYPPGSRQPAAGQRPSMAWRGSGGMAATVATVRRTKANLQKNPWLFSFVLVNFKPAEF